MSTHVPAPVPGAPRRRRSPSLRTRVALSSALGTTLVLLVLGVLAATLLTRSEYDRLDTRLDAAAAAVLEASSSGPGGGVAAVTVRTPQRVRVASGPELPELAVGSTTVEVDGTRYRVRTRAVGRSLVSVGEPVAATLDRVGALQRDILLGGLVSIAVAAALGWVFAGVAVRPLTELAARARSWPPDVGEVRGAREVEQLADDLGTMLGRVRRSQHETAQALVSARDFAATAAHELRTPLTALRTDLEVLAAGLVPEGERPQVLADLLRTQDRVTETLTTLLGLATTDTADDSELAGVDLTELVHRVAVEQGRLHPEVEVGTWPGPPAPAHVQASGLVLALVNLVTNAVRHGGAGVVRLGASAGPGGAELVCDDDGRGIPVPERETVLQRSVRGAGVVAPGSGLGLALVVQQARRHGGTVVVTDSPLGGARVLVRLGAGGDGAGGDVAGGGGAAPAHDPLTAS